MLRAVIIGHTYVVSANRGKLRRIADHPGIELTLLCPGFWDEPDFGKKPFEKEEKISSVVLSAKNVGKARRWFFPTSQFHAAIKAIKPNIIQLEAEASSAIALQVSFLKYFHSFRFVLFAWENIQPRSFVHRITGKFTYRNISYLLAGNDGAQDVAKKMGYRNEISVIPQIGIDPECYEQSDSLDPWEGRKGVRIGYIGRLASHKGVDTLIEAMQKIPQGFLTVVGDGSQKQALLQKVKNSGLTNQVHFTGGVKHEEVLPYLKALDMLVLPSVTTAGWKEQFGHIIIEAMASGIPVIGSDCGAIPDVIGDAGIVFRQKDTKGLVQSILSVAENQDRAKTLSEKGKQRVEMFFTNQVLADKTIEIWKRIIEGK